MVVRKLYTFGQLMLLGMIVSFSSFFINQFFSFPYPPFNTLPDNETYLMDLGGIMLGMRRIAADIAWVQLMQYYARGEMSAEEQFEIEYNKFIVHKQEHDHADHDKETCEHCVGPYHPDYNAQVGSEKLFEKTMRVVHIDPFFHYAYLYSAGALAWNLNRYDEAYRILEKGIANDPSYWEYHKYMAGIMYKQKGDYESMMKLLEEVVTFKDCPNMLKAILANYYKKTNQYVKAIKLWIVLYESKDPEYYRKAQEEIQFLKKALNLPG